MLTDKGCKYDLKNRPGGGVNLIPYENKKCFPYKNPIDEIKKWEPYQNLLSKLVKRITGKSVNEVFRENVEEVFTTILIKNFDGISEREIADMLSGINDLVECFQEEYKNAKLKVESIKSIRR